MAIRSPMQRLLRAPYRMRGLLLHSPNSPSLSIRAITGCSGTSHCLLNTLTSTIVYEHSFAFVIGSIAQPFYLVNFCQNVRKTALSIALLPQNRPKTFSLFPKSPHHPSLPYQIFFPWAVPAHSPLAERRTSLPGFPVIARSVATWQSAILGKRIPAVTSFPRNDTKPYGFPCHCEERSDVAIRSSQKDDPGSHVEKFLLHFGKNYVRIPRVSKSGLTLGCRQAVRHQTLTLAFVGSNPAIPAMTR